jgi:hypothetical protein
MSEPFQVILLRHQAAGEGNNTSPDDRDSWPSWVKEIDRGALAEPDGGRWVPLWALSSPDGGRGVVTFNRFLGSVPEQVRVVIYLPHEMRLVVTGKAPTQPYYTDLTADLSPDGTASLGLPQKGSLVLVLGVMRENIGGLTLAFLLTLLIELPILVVCAWIGGRRDVLSALLWTALLGNVITLPLVWFICVYAKFTGAEAGGLVFLCSEAAAACFEGWLYSRLAGIQLGRALVWSWIANGASLLVGCGLVEFTV